MRALKVIFWALAVLGIGITVYRVWASATTGAPLQTWDAVMLTITCLCTVLSWLRDLLNLDAPHEYR